MDLITLILNMTLHGYGAWGAIFVALTVLEFVVPIGERTLAGRIRAIGYWACWIPASAATVALTLALSKWLHLRPLFTIPVIQSLALPNALLTVMGPVLGILVGDFMAYWHHRIQHRFLWQYHAVHHSIRDMNAVNSYHHVSETFFSVLIITLPTSLIVIDTGPILWWLPVLTWFQVVYLHSPTRISLGPLRAVFTDNRYHRIHHSLEERHFDANFGIVFSIWDRMFGTWHKVERNEWPDVGLADMPEPTTVREWIDLPARYGTRASIPGGPVSA